MVFDAAVGKASRRRVSARSSRAEHHVMLCARFSSFGMRGLDLTTIIPAVMFLMALLESVMIFGIWLFASPQLIDIRIALVSASSVSCLLSVT